MTPPNVLVLPELTGGPNAGQPLPFDLVEHGRVVVARYQGDPEDVTDTATYTRLALRSAAGSVEVDVYVSDELRPREQRAAAWDAFARRACRTDHDERLGALRGALEAVRRIILEAPAGEASRHVTRAVAVADLTLEGDAEDA